MRNVCSTSDGEAFSIWKAFDGEAVFLDNVCLMGGLSLGGSEKKGLCRELVRRIEKGALTSDLEPHYCLLTTVLEILLILLPAGWSKSAEDQLCDRGLRGAPSFTL